MKNGSLLPFEGFIAPGFYFDSGYAVWLARFTNTPVDVGAFAQIWLVDPDGRRTLYVDPETAGPTVALFHDPNDGCGATTDWELPTPEVLRLRLAATDRTAFDLTLTLGRASEMWLLNSLLSGPSALRGNGAAKALVDRGLKSIFGAGLALSGKTERGRAYRLEAKRATPVREAKAVLNGLDLGSLVRPRQAIRFGDLQLPERPGVLFGSMYLQYTAWRSDSRLAI